MKPTSEWPEAHKRLRRLYDERIAPHMSQDEAAHRLGWTQSMVSQYLRGERPLNIQAAEKFAVLLRCSIFEISPEMGRYLADKVVPVLGRKIAVRMLSIILLIPPMLITHEEAKANSVLRTASVYYVKYLSKLVLAFLNGINRCAGLLGFLRWDQPAQRST